MNFQEVSDLSFSISPMPLMILSYNLIATYLGQVIEKIILVRVLLKISYIANSRHVTQNERTDVECTCTDSTATFSA